MVLKKSDLIKICVMIIGINLFLSGNGYSVECGGDIECGCGDTLIANYVLKEDLQCIEKGIVIDKDYISLDCNGNKIIGNNTEYGILVNGRTNVNIKNCGIENFTNGIRLIDRQDYIPPWNTATMRISSNIQISNNTFFNNEFGIKMKNGGNINISENNFINNSAKGIYLEGNNIYISNNDFFKTSIYFPTTRGKYFCKDDIGNNYYDNATNFGCDCIPILPNITINSKVNFCPQTYNLESEIKIEKDGFLDCNNAILIGNKSKTSILIEGSVSNAKISNCQIQNSNTAIEIKPQTKLECWTFGCYYQTYNPSNIEISNNLIIKNNKGVTTKDTSNIDIINNTFKNNSQHSIFLDDKTANIWGNAFYDFATFHTTTKGKQFCNDNISNVYFNNIKGTNCDCHVPVDGQIVDSQIKLCLDVYSLPNGIKLSDYGDLDCNNAIIKGNDDGNGILLPGARYTSIKNCNIKNYQNGIKYTYIPIPPTYSLKTSISNEIINNTISEVANAIYMDNYGRAEKIHGNNFITDSYNIYNNNEYNMINATNNWWGYDDENLFEAKFFDKDKIIYEPYIKKGIELDLSIKEKNIHINEQNITLVIENINRVPFVNFNITIFEIYNYSVIEKRIISTTTAIDNDMIIVIDDWKITNNHELEVIIDAQNHLNEINRANNYARKTYRQIPKYYIESDINPDIANQKIIEHIKKKFGLEFYTQDIEESKLKIIIRQKQDSNDLVDWFNPLSDLKKPYEAKISNRFDDIEIIEIVGEDIEGIVTAVRELTSNINHFVLEKNNLYIDSHNLDAIAIYDYMHNLKNYLFFRTNTNIFGNIVESVLNDKKYTFREIKVPVEYFDEILEYRLWQLFPENSIEFRNFTNKDLYPIVMGRGLWSNISSWEDFGRELANQGHDVYLIELTGGENECDECYDYTYEFLTNSVYPAYINTVLNLSQRDKIKYIGFSNGARVSLDSLERGEVNLDLVETLILVGVPGAFEELSYFAKILNESGQIAIERLESKNISHVTFSRVAFELEHWAGELISVFSYLFGDDNKISKNLFKQYYEWISRDDDEQPGKNLNIENFVLIYGDAPLFNNNDGIVSVKDEKAIFNNVISENKKLYQTNLLHSLMGDSTIVKKIIKTHIN